MGDGGEWPSEPEAAERIRRRSSQRLVTPPGPVTFVSRAMHAAPIERLFQEQERHRRSLRLESPHFPRLDRPGWPIPVRTARSAVYFDIQTLVHV